MYTKRDRPAPARLVGLLLAAAGAATAARAADEGEPKVGQRLERKGDEIVVCGQLFHTTAPVVLWTDPGGYDAYRVERRFVPADQAGWEASHAAGLKSPVRFGMRRHNLGPEQLEEIRQSGWTLDRLRDVVDQFVIHYDVCGTSRRCFQVLHDGRGLSVQFMLDVDGTIYQTMDLKEAAWHATIANGRSVGIEIANMGAYPPGESDTLKKWYAKGADGKTHIVLPEGEKPYLRNPDASLRPARDEPIVGNVQGRELMQYDLTPEQYDSLIKLTATLTEVFPKIRLQYPEESAGGPVPKKLDDAKLKEYQGVLGHYHIQTNKTDPGPAFQWDKVIQGARSLVTEPPIPPTDPEDAPKRP
jgi:N-acetyl-anhydromuramyl-L-alanine amidase AmpD